MKKLVLNNAGLSLGLAVNETGWCNLQLTGNGVRHQLGAESVNVVKRRLVSALGDAVALNPTRLMRNIDVSCVLNLHVRPWSIYLGSSGDRRHLFFRNRDEGLIIETVISESERGRWRDALTSFSTEETSLVGRFPLAESLSSAAA